LDNVVDKAVSSNRHDVPLLLCCAADNFFRRCGVRWQFVLHNKSCMFERKFDLVPNCCGLTPICGRVCQDKNI
jgi:hypothetical protein